LILLLLRLSNTKSFGFLLILFLSFQIGGVFALIKTGDYIEFLNDVIVATKWFNVPLSFFYFKHLFNRQQTHSTIIPNAHKFIRYSLIFLSINMILGILGYGMAFYNHGYSNAIGTKGFIYAGNELTILLLAIGFSIALWCYVNKQFKSYFLFFGLIMFFAFLMTSK